ncbi:Xaa-Pro dipeptidase [Trichoplax sp. H2]|nr:Xaa-Pro dipeptidase [Trichoplax sp. H2]|eukprot:RDD46926.1 Xaa-Pro dipeptidase [Trichoplax sp. H2]
MVGSTYSMGQQTATVVRSLHALNRQRLNGRLKKRGVKNGAIVLLQGGKSIMRHNTDHEPLFRQESYFHWTFGVCEPDYYGAIDVDNNTSILFCPKLPAEYAVWMGEILSTEQIKNKYDVDEVHYTEEIKQVLQAKKPSTLLLLKGKNTDSGLHTIEADFDGIDSFETDRTSLHPEISECRVTKSHQELDIMRYVNGISSQGHIQLMRSVRPGMKEYELESIFLNHCYSRGGCRYVAYSGIVASGSNSAVLHYGHAAVPNNKTIDDGDLW